ncbi:MAG: restriction endonuclease subunit S [Clostridium argentinense]|nr:restriction endonuclease subunit S [Clostridium argentinense]
MLVKYKLCELGDIFTGNTPSKKNSEFYDSKDIMFIKPDDINNNITEIKSSKEYISNKAEKKARIVPKDSLLITCIGSIGKIAINKKESAFNQQINSIVHNEKIISSKYLAYVFKVNKQRLEAISNAPVVPIINKTQFSEFEVYIHEKKEIQQKIVYILDRAQSLIDKRKTQIEALDELVKSRFIEMFGDPIQNPLGWELKPFLESGSCKNGMNFGADETGIELQYLGVGDFKDLSKIDDVSSLGKVSLNQMPSKEYILQDGDIVFVRSNGNKALVGRCLAVYPKGISTTYSGFCIRYRKTDEKLEIPYLLQVLKTDSMRKNMAGRGANIQNLNQQILGQLMIPMPPLELQKEFSDFINQVDKLKFEMEKSLKELEDNFNSLMQKAFNGELFN